MATAHEEADEQQRDEMTEILERAHGETSEGVFEKSTLGTWGMVESRQRRRAYTRTAGKREEMTQSIPRLALPSHTPSP